MASGEDHRGSVLIGSVSSSASLGVDVPQDSANGCGVAYETGSCYTVIVKEETYPQKMIRSGYVEQKMREGYTYDEAMKMFDEWRTGQRRTVKRKNEDRA